MRNATMSGWLSAAAHINAVCSRKRSLALTLAPCSTSSSAIFTAPVRAASITGVSPSSLALFASAPASSSILTRFTWATLAASARGLEPNALTTSAFTPRASNALTSSSSTRYTAQCSGVVPSGCAAFTAALRWIISSAALRSPASIRSASALSDCAKEVTTAADNTHVRAISDLNRLNNIGRQLVMVSPQPFVDVIEEFIGIVKSPGQTIHHARFQHVLGAVPLANSIERSVIDGLHHIALGLQLRAAHHGAVSGDDSRLVVAELQQPIHCVDPSADPRAGEVIQFGITRGRRYIADCKHVAVSEDHVEFHAGVRFNKVAIVDLFSTCL